jgi:hypothetical protein
MDIPIVKFGLPDGSRACILVRQENESCGQRFTIDYIDSSNSLANLLGLVGLGFQGWPSYPRNTTESKESANTLD